MNSSVLTNLLFSSGIATDGYDFDVVSVPGLKKIREEITASSNARVSERQSLTFVEIESSSTIWLVTRPGHFAHPSALKRKLSEIGKTRIIQVSGITAGDPEVCRVWMEQFREQDAQMVRAFS
ncbi:hypothetical protein LPN04_07400 [Rugamonas sp. A1-17]|nr:hypothetical protein [Rugamonas sp. A1-17]